MLKALVSVAGAIAIALAITRLPEFGLEVTWSSDVCGLGVNVSRQLGTFLCTYLLALGGFLLSWKR